MEKFLIIFFILLLNVNILIFYKKIIKIINIFDLPNATKKLHMGPVPAIGGFILFANLMVYFCLNFIFYGNFFINFYQFSIFHSLIFILTIVSLFFSGAYDDKYSISPTNKLLIFFCIFYLLCEIDGTIEFKNLKISFFREIIPVGETGIFLSILFFMTIIFSINMIDGINGNVILYFIFLTIYLIFYYENLLLFLLIVLICLLFILTLNLKNKLFLGDSGCYLLGFIFSYILLKNYQFNKIENFDKLISFFFIPLLDMTRLFFIRVFNGKNPLFGDLNHLHHILTFNLGYFRSISLLVIFYNYQFHFYDIYNNKIYYFVSILILYSSLLFLPEMLKNNKVKK